MQNDRVCQGYTVIDSLRVGEVEIVLAHNLKAVSPYRPTERTAPTYTEKTANKKEKCL